MPRHHHPSRRDFLGVLAAGAALHHVPDLLARDPYHPIRMFSAPDLVRVEGTVRGAGRPLARVAVSDGLRVAVTDADGRYHLAANPAMPGVFVSTPAHYAFPVTASGTLAQHLPIRADAPVDFRLDRLADSDAHHGFVALADPQTLDVEDMAAFHATTVPAVQQAIAALGDRAAFGVTVGDILWDDLSLYPEYERAVSRTGLPFAQVVGNHDLDLTRDAFHGSTRTFSRHFGPTWYSFNRGAVHYVVLNNVLWHGTDYTGHFVQEQLDWLAADLALVERGAPVVVFVHIPLTTTTVARNPFYKDAPMRTTNPEALWRLLEPFRAQVITGHTHEMEHQDHGRRAHEHNVATACGAWWTGPICADGSPSGFAVYEVEGEQLRWRYQATGRPAGERLRVYPAGSDPARPTQIIANVWDWDPMATVTWYAGADRRGLMTRQLGKDPLSIRLHTGPDLPPKHPWAEPLATDHLFHCTVDEASGPVRVEVTDRFGETTSAVPRALES